MARRRGRPRIEAKSNLGSTAKRVRRLIDLAHMGNVQDASRLTGVSYPTLNDIYSGKTQNPSLKTLESIGLPYGLGRLWFLSEEADDSSPRIGRIGLLPPDPHADIKQRALREVLIPYTAWSFYELFTSLEDRISKCEPSATRPIVGEAKGDALVFRLTTFLFQPLLAAEKAGVSGRFPTQEEFEKLDTPMRDRWVQVLKSLGDVWSEALRDLSISATDSSNGAVV